MFTATRGLLGRLPDWRSKRFALLALLLLLGYQTQALHLHERLYFALKSVWHEEHWQERSLWLPDYSVKTEALPLAGIGSNLSGLAYDAGRDQLWAVLNNPEELLALSTRGEVLARYPLQGFQDVEGVAYLGDDLLLLAEERSQTLAIVPLPAYPGTLSRQDARTLTLGIDNDEGDNQGFEGVAYDPAGDRLFVVKEHSPRKLYEVRGLKSSLGGELNLTVIDRDAWLRHKGFASDLSSVEFDARTGHLLLLSDASKLVLELDARGKMVSYRSLRGGFAGLEESVPQAEGLTLDERGDLYLVSEPNLFYVFGRRP